VNDQNSRVAFKDETLKTGFLYAYVYFQQLGGDVIKIINYEAKETIQSEEITESCEMIEDDNDYANSVLFL